MKTFDPKHRWDRAEALVRKLVPIATADQISPTETIYAVLWTLRTLLEAFELQFGSMRDTDTLHELKHALKEVMAEIDQAMDYGGALSN